MTRFLATFILLLCARLSFGVGDSPEDTTQQLPTCPLFVADDCPTPKPIRLFDRVPADSIYGVWISTDVNPYRVSLDSLPESLELVLIDSLECDFVAPVKGRVTSPFGPRRSRTHKGTDIDLQTGDTVRCAFDGVIRVAEYSGGYGNVVVVRHHNGLETVYAHLSRMAVVPGETIRAGDLLGLGGQTGRATGSHLHFEVRYLGVALDSSVLIDWERFQLRHNQVVLCRDMFAGS